MGQNRGRDHEHDIARPAGRTEPDEREIIAHKHAEAEMAGNREQRARNRDREEVFGILEDIHEILERGEAHGDADGVHDTVHPLVEIRVHAKKAPENKQFRQLLRYGRPEERGGYAAAERMNLRRIQARPAERD